MLLRTWTSAIIETVWDHFDRERNKAKRTIPVDPRRLAKKGSHCMEECSYQLLTFSSLLEM